MTFPTVEDITASVNGAQDTSHTVDFPSTVNVDDLLIMINCFWYQDQDPTGPSGWTQIFYDAESQTSNRLTLNIYAKKADGTEDGGTWGFTSVNNTTRATQIYRISGWGGTLADDVDVSASTNEGSSTSPDPASVTAGWGSDDNLFIEVTGLIDDNGQLTSASANYTNLTQTDDTGGGSNQQCSLGTARRELAASSDDPGTMTVDQSERWSAMTIVIKPAAASGTVNSKTLSDSATVTDGSPINA